MTHHVVRAAQFKHMNAYPGPRSVLLVDNCRIHDVDELMRRARRHHVRVIFLEPYDPHHMPIEVGFRAMKRCAGMSPLAAGMPRRWHAAAGMPLAAARHAAPAQPSSRAGGCGRTATTFAAGPSTAR